MKTVRLSAVIIGIFTLFIVGCSPIITTDNKNEATIPTLEPRPGSIPQQGDPLKMTPTVPPPTNPAMQSLIEKAKEDLAQRLSISTNQIDILEAASVIWPDSSLGCPQKGMAYAEVLTPGYLIVLTTGNDEYEYHTSTGTEVIYCANPTPPIEGTPDNV